MPAVSKATTPAGAAGSGVQAATLTTGLAGDVCSVVGVIDFATAPACLEAVNACIAKQPSLTIDMAGVSRTNSAGLALMIEWLSQARQHNHQVRFQAVPDALRQLADVCQVDGLI